MVIAPPQPGRARAQVISPEGGIDPLDHLSPLGWGQRAGEGRRERALGYRQATRQGGVGTRVAGKGERERFERLGPRGRGADLHRFARLSSDGCHIASDGTLWHTWHNLARRVNPNNANVCIANVCILNKL